jgi:hypothetical protein
MYQTKAPQRKGSERCLQAFENGAGRYPQSSSNQRKIHHGSARKERAQLLVCACHEEKAGDAPAHREWRQQEFSRIVTLPAKVDADKVEAHYRNGMLTVTLPKTKPSTSRKIAVQS